MVHWTIKTESRKEISLRIYRDGRRSYTPKVVKYGFILNLL